MLADRIDTIRSTQFFATRTMRHFVSAVRPVGDIVLVSDDLARSDWAAIRDQVAVDYSSSADATAHRGDFLDLGAGLSVYDNEQWRVEATTGITRFLEPLTSAGYVVQQAVVEVGGCLSGEMAREWQYVSDLLEYQHLGLPEALAQLPHRGRIVGRHFETEGAAVGDDELGVEAACREEGRRVLAAQGCGAPEVVLRSGGHRPAQRDGAGTAGDESHASARFRRLPAGD